MILNKAITPNNILLFKFEGNTIESLSEQQRTCILDIHHKLYLYGANLVFLPIEIYYNGSTFINLTWSLGYRNQSMAIFTLNLLSDKYKHVELEANGVFSESEVGINSLKIRFDI